MGHGIGNVGAKNGRTIEFLVSPVGGLPNLAEGALFGENDLGIKHVVVVACLVLLLAVVVVGGVGRMVVVVGRIMIMVVVATHGLEVGAVV